MTSCMAFNSPRRGRCTSNAGKLKPMNLSPHHSLNWGNPLQWSTDILYWIIFTWWKFKGELKQQYFGDYLIRQRKMLICNKYKFNSHISIYKNVVNVQNSILLKSLIVFWLLRSRNQAFMQLRMFWQNIGTYIKIKIILILWNSSSIDQVISIPTSSLHKKMHILINRALKILNVPHIK